MVASRAGGADGTLATTAMTRGNTWPAAHIWISGGTIYAYMTHWPAEPDRLGDIWAWRPAPGGVLEKVDGPAAYLQ